MLCQGEDCANEADGYVVRGQGAKVALLCHLFGTHVAGVGATAHDVGCAHEHCHAAFGSVARGFFGGGEFADAHTVGKGLVHVFEQGVVVACHGQLSLVAEGHNTCRIAVRAGVAPCLQLVHHAAELLVRPGDDLAVVGAVAFGVAPLALARGVVH